MKQLKQVSRDYGCILMIISFIMLCGLIYNAFLTANTLRIVSHELAIQRISLNLGISPNWKALRIYLKDTLHEGMPRDEVLKELDKIGPYIIETEPDCELVEFQLGLERRTRYRICFYYNNDEINSLRSYIIVSD